MEKKIENHTKLENVRIGQEMGTVSFGELIEELTGKPFNEFCKYNNDFGVKNGKSDLE